MNIVVMCGNIAVGKSYFAKYIAERLNYRYLNIDDCYAILNGNENIHENKFEVWQLFFQLIHKCIDLNQDVVVDTNTPFIRDRQEFLDWFPEFETHKLVWVSAPFEESLEHNLKRSRKVPEETMIRLAKSFEPPTLNEPGGRSEWDDIYKIEHNFDIEYIVTHIKGSDDEFIRKAL